MKKKFIVVITILTLFAGIFVGNSILSRKIHTIVSDSALTLLKEGNTRFAEEKQNHPNQSAEYRAQTSQKGQKPFAVVLACSDSRVPVEILFDAGIGDIFVVRNAGNIAEDDITAGSIEYAVKHLKVPLLVILGHTECGVVKAALSGVPAEGNIRVIQKIIEPSAAEVEKSSPSLKKSELLNAVIKANVLKSKKDLLVRSEIVKSFHDKGALEIVTAVYNMETGKVDWND